MSRVIPIMQTVNNGVSIRVGHAVRMENSNVFVLEIDRDLASVFVRTWFDRIATFILSN